MRQLKRVVVRMDQADLQRLKQVTKVLSRDTDIRSLSDADSLRIALRRLHTNLFGVTVNTKDPAK